MGKPNASRDPPGMRRLASSSREDRVSLAPFEEVVSKLHSIRSHNETVVIELSNGTLEFDASSTEAAICQRELPSHEDERIAILRSRSSNRPLIVRTL